MCQTFKDDEPGYLAWLDQHPAGFVFNDFDGQRVLHRAACTHLRAEKDAGRRTVYPKICSTALDQLKSHVTKEYGPEKVAWNRCAAQGTNCFLS